METAVVVAFSVKVGRSAWLENVPVCQEPPTATVPVWTSPATSRTAAPVATLASQAKFAPMANVS